MPGDLLDLILIVLAAAFAVAGYRQGFIIGAMSFAGFIGGVGVGAVIAPGVSRTLASSAGWQAFIALITVFATAVACMVLASVLGAMLRSRVRSRPATVLDSLGGAAINVAAMLLVAWLIGSFVAYAPFPAISRQVNNSLVLRTVDGLVPHSALTLPMFPPLRRLFNSGPYTQVFGAFGAESVLGVGHPDPAVLAAAGLARDRASIVKVEGVAPSCSRRIEGSGFVISPSHVLTNAHVVAGVTADLRVYSSDGAGYPAQVVLYDPRRDVAVLDVPGLAAQPLHFAGPAAYGAQAIVAGYPLNHAFTAVAARVATAEEAVGPDLYMNTNVRRQIYPIRAKVEPGNSGGPLLAPDGRVYGVVFAAAVAVPDTGYALTAAEVASDVADGAHATAVTSTQGCQ